MERGVQKTNKFYFLTDEDIHWKPFRSFLQEAWSGMVAWNESKMDPHPSFSDRETKWTTIQSTGGFSFFLSFFLELHSLDIRPTRLRCSLFNKSCQLIIMNIYNRFHNRNKLDVRFLRRKRCLLKIKTCFLPLMH